MTPRPPDKPPGNSRASRCRSYRIRATGVADELAAALAEEWTVERTGETITITGRCDQAALHGLLLRLRSAHGSLVSLRRAEDPVNHHELHLRGVVATLLDGALPPHHEISYETVLVGEADDEGLYEVIDTIYRLGLELTEVRLADPAHERQTGNDTAGHGPVMTKASGPVRFRT